VLLSIIIVNYNVKYFVEQCLQSVFKASTNISCEVIVVDNNSKDGSVEMISQKFPQVSIIANKENPGFSKANNQAIANAKGEYILLLNPDTLVSENTFDICIAYMQKHANCGALGCKMIDGTGQILPESKRGFPKISTSFFKLTGLYKLFPTHKIINHYYLGDKSYNENCEAEILTGAFFFMRKLAQEKVGLLDESFFMYGEDIDYSYRFILAGYKIAYIADTQIIHYKGESTKKGSLNYVRVFYQAMIIFAKKHFSGSKAGSYIIFLQLAIYLKAFLTLIENFFQKFLLPCIDFIVIIIGLYAMQQVWASQILGNPEYYASAKQMWINAPIYALIWILSLYFSSVYDYKNTLYRILRGIFFGFIVNASIYSFFPLSLRSSRALLLLGTLWSFISIPIVHLILHYIRFKNFNLGESKLKRVAIVGNVEEAFRVEKMYKQLTNRNNFLGVIIPDFYNEINNPIQNTEILGKVTDIKEIIQLYKINEIIFCAKNFNNTQIIHWMNEIGAKVDFKIVPEDSLSIIGSHSKNTSGDLLAVDINFNIAQKHSIRNKRIVDIIFCIIFILFSMILLFFQDNKITFFKNILSVFIGNKTWVGYNINDIQEDLRNLPNLKKSVLNISQHFSNTNQIGLSNYQMNFVYAKQYSIEDDLNIIMKNLNKLG
jgi:GT2 family glycosyltransferase